MEPDVKIALYDLDVRTPSFFVDEMWPRGDPRSVQAAREIISSLGTLKGAAYGLRARLRLVYGPNDETPFDGYRTEGSDT